MRYFAVVMTLVVMLAGCATAPPSQSAPIDVSGPWAGTWDGYGIAVIKRLDAANAQFTQQGDSGYGRLWLDGTLASESVPLVLRLAGLSGVPVLFEVNGDRVTIRHQIDETILKGEFTVTGDRMEGRLLNTPQPARIVLERVRAKVAAASPPPPPAPVTPPPPPLASVRQPAATETAPPPPATARPAPQEFSPAEAVKPVYFDFDRWEVRPGEAIVLDANANWLQSNRDTLVIVEGHCDERGTNAYNLALGERRARAVRDYLVSRGVAADRITTVSYGEERPVCTERTEDCWRKNRPAAFVVKAK